MRRRLLLNEVVNFLGKVEYNRYAQYEHQRKEECPEELPYDIPVKYAGQQLFQALSDIFRTVSSFHDPNVPSSILSRASLTRLR